MKQTADNVATVELAQLGRKRDHSRDAAILDATINVLGDIGYTAMKGEWTHPTYLRKRSLSASSYTFRVHTGLHAWMISLL